MLHVSTFEKLFEKGIVSPTIGDGKGFLEGQLLKLPLSNSL
jgi:hypothetical protein